MNTIITTLLTSLPDPQRGVRMNPDPKLLRTLHDSVRSEFVVLATDLEPGPELPNARIVRVEQRISPYFERWLQIFRFLRSSPEIDQVWCVDGTDVEMLRNPFPEMEPGRIYVGHEPTIVDIPWMRDNHGGALMAKLYHDHGNHRLLNAGLIGGSRADVMSFAHDITKMWADGQIDQIAKRAGPKFVRREVTNDRDLRGTTSDMGAFNFVCLEKYPDKISFGPRVNTVFKAFDYTNKEAWWRHK